MKRYTLAAVAALLVLMPWLDPVRAEPPHYQVQNLGTFEGSAPSVVGISAAGQILGNATDASGNSVAVRYIDGLGWRTLPGFSGWYVANGISATGAVTGYHVTSAGLRAFRYRDDAGIDDIEPLPGGSMTVGYAVNAAGDVVGYSDSSAGFVPFRASVGSDAVALPHLAGSFSFACAINDNGQVAGNSTTASGTQHGIRVDPGVSTPTDIASFDGDPGGVTTCAIDSDGTVGGQSAQGGSPRAFTFGAAGSMALDTFTSSTQSTVLAISGGLSVGYFQPGTGGSRAFAHRDRDGSFDLNTVIDTPGWVLEQASGVNADGVIVGNGTFNGVAAAFRLAPSAAADTTAPVIEHLAANPDTIFPPKGQAVPITLTVEASDDSGQTPTCGISTITVAGASSNDAVVTGALSGSVAAVGGRTYTFAVKCADAASNTVAASVDVTVQRDTTAPVIHAVTATPNSLWPPDNRPVAVAVSVSATDDVDDAPACWVNSVLGVVAADDARIDGPLQVTLRAAGGRNYLLGVKCADAAGNAASATTSVLVPPDTTAPVITSLAAAPEFIWPANNKMVPVSISAQATDDVDAAPVCTLTGISGAPAGDVVVTGPFSARVRASRNADGSVRTYLFSVSCSDNAGNTALGAVEVSVGKDAAMKVYHFSRPLRRLLEGLVHSSGHGRR